MPELLDAIEVAQLTGAHIRTVLNAFRAGHLGTKDDEGKWRATKRQAEMWLNATYGQTPKAPTIHRLHRGTAHLIPDDYAERIRALRERLCLTAVEFYDLIYEGTGAKTQGGKKKTIWQWEQPKGSKLARTPWPKSWRKIVELENRRRQPVSESCAYCAVRGCEGECRRGLRVVK